MAEFGTCTRCGREFRVYAASAQSSRLCPACEVDFVDEPPPVPLPRVGPALALARIDVGTLDIRSGETPPLGEVDRFREIAVRMETLTQDLAEAEPDRAERLLKALGIDDPNRYPGSIEAFGNLRAYGRSSQAEAADHWRLGDEGRPQVLCFQLDDPVMPIGFACCRLEAGALLGGYTTGTGLVEASRRLEEGAVDEPGSLEPPGPGPDELPAPAACVHEVVHIDEAGGGFETWTLRLTESHAEFADPDGTDRVLVDRASAPRRIASEPDGTLVVHKAVGTRTFQARPDVQKAVADWLQAPARDIEDLGPYLRGWGIGLAVAGYLHFVIPGLFAPMGVALLILGILNLLVMRRQMITLNGVVLILMGVLNLIALLAGAVGPVLVGAAQVILGIREIKTFDRLPAPHIAGDGARRRRIRRRMHVLTVGAAALLGVSVASLGMAKNLKGDDETGMYVLAAGALLVLGAAVANVVILGWNRQLGCLGFGLSFIAVPVLLAAVFPASWAIQRVEFEMFQHRAASYAEAHSAEIAGALEDRQKTRDLLGRMAEGPFGKVLLFHSRNLPRGGGEEAERILLALAGEPGPLLALNERLLQVDRDLTNLEHYHMVRDDRGRIVAVLNVYGFHR